jgi:hypothetical protein
MVRRAIHLLLPLSKRVWVWVGDSESEDVVGWVDSTILTLTLIHTHPHPSAEITFAFIFILCRRGFRTISFIFEVELGIYSLFC